LQDEIKKFSKKKILLIEPVDYNLKDLKERTKNFPNVIIEPVAVSDKDETLPFYHIKRSSIDKLKKHWASGIGSFNKDHILKHKSKRFKVSDEDIEEIEIQCLSFKSLVKKYSIKKIEKLLIDVEGAEYKILKSINYKEILIQSIIFEKKHFDGTFNMGSKLKEIKDLLIENNYELFDLDEENIIAKKIE
tara:strand:+ start:652 stop:1221 length:570 start_codon:yes stop_codon:yes gene_type:complete